ncbi:hypothetical protein [uncultured Roseibium sp.]|uniref:hypothetical protein n=1 Tax=uncultured Roseibium sp. TaxID=1936171 RepID=UPI002621A466|nr:hypothetical protein [uncultured Roseibium sp.]
MHDYPSPKGMMPNPSGCVGTARSFARATILVVSSVATPLAPAMAQSTPVITIDPTVPDELNPTGGGAPKATLAQASAFAWQEFIALSWPAGPQEGMPGQREAPSTTVKFGDPSYNGPLVWETMRNKVETFPGYNAFKEPSPPPPPPGYIADASKSYGYDALPAYKYSTDVPPCHGQTAPTTPPWINLDETDEITLASMFAGVVSSASSATNAAPKLVRFLAKSNRTHFEYIVGNSSTVANDQQWWNAIPKQVVADTKTYLAANRASPPVDMGDKLVSLRNGTIETKAGWRELNADEMASGRFHTQLVRYYEEAKNTHGICYRDATWGLVALHIIHKTPTAPYFIYATFEQADNILTADGKPVEDEDGNIVVDVSGVTSLEPQVCLNDPRPAMTAPSGTERASNAGNIVLTKNFETVPGDPLTCADQQSTVAFCDTPGSRIYYQNTKFPSPNNAPSEGKICVNKRENAIPADVIAANSAAHDAISDYVGSAGSPWLAYKLINVQYVPHDKDITIQTKNGSIYSGTDPLPSTFYLANIMVETNRSLQLFSGGLSENGTITTDWNTDGTEHKNSYYGGHFYAMGGCMGCHGSQGQNPLNQAGDFSVITARGSVSEPEAPAPETTSGISLTIRNRSLR